MQQPPAPPLARRLAVGAALVAVGVTGGVVTAAQVRGDRPSVVATVVDDVPAMPVPDPEREAVAVAVAWAEAVAMARAELAVAEETLQASAGQVADETTRDALADAVSAVRTALGAEQTAAAVTTVTEAVAALGPAVVEVRRAHRIWAVDHPDLAPTPPDPRSTTSAGAGPDCGGPDSIEPPVEDGPVFFTSTPAATGDGSNGSIPRAQMTALPWCADSLGNQQWLRADAAAALIALNEAFRAEFGENIAVDLSYRSYADQVAMREVYGSLAAQPGTSSHGLGTAVDTWEWQAYAFGSPRYIWLVENGPSHGWIAPGWARENGSNPEYWHFEFQD